MGLFFLVRLALESYHILELFFFQKVDLWENVYAECCGELMELMVLSSHACGVYRLIVAADIPFGKFHHYLVLWDFRVNLSSTCH